MILTETLQIATFAVAAISSTIAILSFRRNKKIELQNQLFKIKLEAFANIIFEIDRFSTVISQALHLVIKLAEQKNIEQSKERFFALADEIDEHLFACNSLIIKNSVYFSAESTTLLMEFSNNILGNSKLNTDPNLLLLIDELDAYYSKQLDLANNAVDKIRVELGLEKLNSSLYKRVN